MIRLNDVPLHGKFLAWDDDDIAVTSLNWGSARAQGDYPQADIGVHIHGPGVAANLIARYIERYRWIAWLGLVVILWVATKMIWDGYHDVAPVLGWPAALEVI